ncbi:MAG: hypothetical protein C0424_05490 [Sphingobacteriaceae bacterium]|nr:hypothetical protein [Sphingobacteriaceae bacterium]
MIRAPLVFSFFILIGSACDNVDLRASDVTKYAWLRPFIFEHEHFEGTHNLDLGTLDFGYEYLESYDDFLRNVDSLIKQEKWTLVKSENGVRIIEKEMEQYDGFFKVTTIYLEVDSNSTKAAFKIE